MDKTKDKNDGECSCCRMEAVVSIDERGQMILPKDLREKIGIKAGDKFAIVAWYKEGKACCISMLEVGNLTGPVREYLGPIMKNIL